MLLLELTREFIHPTSEAVGSVQRIRSSDEIANPQQKMVLDPKASERIMGKGSALVSLLSGASSLSDPAPSAFTGQKTEGDTRISAYYRLTVLSTFGFISP